MLNDRVISWGEHLSWFDSRWERGEDIWLFCADDRPLGLTSFTGGAGRSCAWGFYIGAPNTAKGTGLMCGYCSLEYVFGWRDVDRIKNQVISFNTASLNFHRKLLFSETGRAPGKINRAGENYDLIFLELVKKEWKEGKAAIIQAARERLARCSTCARPYAGTSYAGNVKRV